MLDEADVRALAAAGAGEVDLEAQEVRFAGRAVPFEIDAEIRRRLLGGLDDIALTLQQEERDRRLRGASASAPGRHDRALSATATATAALSVFRGRRPHDLDPRGGAAQAISR